MRKYLVIILISFASGLAGAYALHYFIPESPAKQEGIPVSKTNYKSPESRSSRVSSTAIPEDFVVASELSTKSVVYVKNISERTSSRSYLDWFFDRSSGNQTQISSGSGVIFSSDGYIISNNHVVQNADKLEVVYNRKTYEAKLVGTDPSTDVAVLKIDEKNLPAVTIGNSSSLAVGEWVIAVGNPFNLTSTVTAGIVSAKGREINILQSKFPIESFIQTDAAINPGNSGGALVNKSGELVGINTAILSRTGSYAGYGFAVPVDIVKKIVGDLIEYGEVQKAFFGGEVSDFNDEVAQRLDIDLKNRKEIRGVVLGYLQHEGAAEDAGMQEGDIILQIGDQAIDTRSEFEEELSYHSPGDKISVTYERDGKSIQTEVTLTNREGTTGILKREIFTSEELGAQFEVVPKVERELLEIDYGVKVFHIQNGLINRIGITDDFIITDINRTAIKEPEQVVNILKNIRGRVIIEGMNKEGRKGYYSFELR